MNQTLTEKLAEKAWPIFSHLETFVYSRPAWALAVLLGGLLLLMIIGWALKGWQEQKGQWQVILVDLFGWLVMLAGAVPLIFMTLWGMAAMMILNLADPQGGPRWWVTLAADLWKPLAAGAGGGLILGALAAFIISRYVQPVIGQWVDSSTSRLDDDQLTDARDIEKHLPAPKKYDPTKYFASAQKKNLMFLGLDEFKKPVAMRRDKWKKTHVQIMGPTGTGKGVQAGVCLAQSIAYGDGVFIFDPKNDEFAPSVMKQQCEVAGVPFALIDLRREAPPQANFLEGITADELNSLFISGFSLSRKGEAADFYRLRDRKAAAATSKIADQDCKEPLTLEKISALGQFQAGEEAENAEGFFSALDEVAALQALQSKSGGHDIASPLKHGGCLYVIGSMDDEAVIILQKMFLIRVIQQISKRKRSEEGRRHVSIFVDEVKYFMSKMLADTMGSVRDKGANILLAHQSLADLKSGEVPDPAVIIDNTHLRWLYRSTTEQNARWIAAQSGEIQVNSESRLVQRNATGAEIGADERRIQKVPRFQIDTNMVQFLPDGCAVVIGAGPARLAFASPVMVDQVTEGADMVVPAQDPEPKPEKEKAPEPAAPAPAPGGDKTEKGLLDSFLPPEVQAELEQEEEKEAS